MQKEQSVEQYLRRQIEARGGTCTKIDPANNKGFPDRLILLPLGRSLLAEVKRPSGGVVSEHQREWQRRIVGMGHGHAFLFNREQIDAFLDGYDELVGGDHA